MSIKSVKYNDIEIVENEYIKRDYMIKISIPEFTCVCPRSGQPDFATIEIRYIPNAHIVELISLKLYLQKYRNVGIFHESATNRILEDFRLASKPRKIEVVGRFNPRGGIRTEVEVRWP